MLTLRVRSIKYEAEKIRSFELVDPEGKDLPPFEAGAHIDVNVPGGFTRQYSLCNSPDDLSFYRIAVLEELEGRGGSKSLHSQIRAGDLITISEPRNQFQLCNDAKHSILLAGGIGITPLLSMIKQLIIDNKSFELHYCTQSLERTAFVSKLNELASNNVFYYHDGGNPKNGLDIANKLLEHKDGTHLYFCGPQGFMKAIKDASTHWPEESIHYEYFGADPELAEKLAASSANGANVRLAKSEKLISVEPGQSILAALRSSGVECSSSCESGLCGSCKVRYIEGSPVHNDFLLSEEERKSYVLVCCAGVGDQELLLDL